LRSADVLITGNVVDVRELQAAVEQLEPVDAGRSIAQAIRDHGVMIRFGMTADDASAQFDPTTNEITIHASQSDAGPAILAAYLAHEGTHVQLGNPTSAADALDQEYRCFKAEVEVWSVVKGSEENWEEGDIAAMIDKGEADAKADIRRRYGDEYFTRWGGKL